MKRRSMLRATAAWAPTSLSLEIRPARMKSWMIAPSCLIVFNSLANPMIILVGEFYLWSSLHLFWSSPTER